MSKLSDDYVRQLAFLARINLSDEDLTKLKPQLENILEYVEQLNLADTKGLVPTAQVTGLSDVARKDDEQTDTFERERLLDQVPKVQDGQIKVPKVL